MKRRLCLGLMASLTFLTPLPGTAGSGQYAAKGVAGEEEKKSSPRVEWLRTPRRAKHLWAYSGGRMHGKVSLEGVYDIALDERNGLLYVPVGQLGRVVVFDAGSGQGLRALGERGDGPGKFLSPLGLDVDGEGNVYVVDNARRTVQVWDREGGFLRELDVGRAGPDPGRNPEFVDVAVDRETGDIHLADKRNRAVLTLDSEGRFLQSIGGTEFDKLSGLQYVRVNPEGELAVGLKRRVVFFTGKGRESERDYDMRRQDGKIAYTRGFDFDGRGNLLALHEEEGGTIYVTGYAPDGRVLFGLVDRAGDRDLPLGSSKAIAVDGKDRVYVVMERRLEAFQIIDPPPGEPQEKRLD